MADMTSSPSLVERLAHKACPAVNQEGPCSGCSMNEKLPRGGVRGCILEATRHIVMLLAAIEEAGYAVVPVKPTIEMLANISNPQDPEFYSMWSELLAAAPKVTE